MNKARFRSIVCRCIVGIPMLFALNAQAASPATPGPNAPMKSFWQLLEEISRQIPWTVENVQGVLGTSLDKFKAGNPIMSFYRSPDFQLSDGLMVHAVLGLHPDRPRQGHLTLTLDGACLTLAEVRSRYQALQLTDAPRGRSPDESTTYSEAQPWGRLSFGFPVKNPDCLGFVVLNSSN